MRLNIIEAEKGDWLKISVDGYILYEGHGDIRGWQLVDLFHGAMGYDSITHEVMPGEEM